MPTTTSFHHLYNWLRRGITTMATALIAIVASHAGPAKAEVFTGQAAQALRCAAYIGMAATFLRDRGEISRSTYDNMHAISTHILLEWVPTDDPIPAYRAVLQEIRSETGTYDRFVRHTDFCLETFVRR